MINPDLERRLADCTELIEAWKIFLEMINRAVKAQENPSPQAEQQFLNVKARIAMLHDSFMESLKHDKSVGSNMLEVVNRSITLKVIRKQSESEQKKTEIEWHEIFLLLNEAVSGMNEEKDDLANVNEMAFRAKKMQEYLTAQAKGFLGSIYFKIIVVVGAILFVIYGVPAFGIYKWDKLRDIRPIAPVISMGLNVSRSIGFSAPYYDLNSQIKKLIPIVVEKPELGIFEIKNEGIDRDTAIRVISGYTGFNSPTLGELLQKSTEYDRIQYGKTAGNNVKGSSLFFWFRNTADAVAAFNEAKTNVPKFYRVERKMNIVVFIQSVDDPFTDTIKSVSLSKLK